ncbi:NADH-quinone oxidoreductase subunit M [soil metagenome]
MIPYLSILTMLPAVGALVLALSPEGKAGMTRGIAFLFAGINLIVALAVLSQFKAGTFHYQFTEYAPWVSSLGIAYRIGVDGISLWMVVLTALLTPLAIASTGGVTSRLKTMLALILLLETAMIGAFISLDLILFFTFFELTLLPMYFIIAIWGGEHRQRAANKFLLYTFAGSIFMLVGMAALAFRYYQTQGQLSFSVTAIQQAVAAGGFWTNAIQAQGIAFWAFAIALLVKTPVFPFHTWIGDSYTEAPVAAPILSSVMVKLGAYGMIRFLLPLFPDAARANAPIFAILAMVSILYGAAVAAVQPNMRRMMAYSTLSHMGFVVLGIFSLTHSGMMGASLGMFAHGVTSAMMLLLIGHLLQARGSTLFRDFGGLKARVPVLTTLFFIALLGSVGLPATNGFVGEILALLGAFEGGMAGNIPIWAAVASGLGVVLAAAYLLYMYQQTFLGPQPVAHEELGDVSELKGHSLFVMAVLVGLIFFGGLQPAAFTKSMELSGQASRLMATAPPGGKPMWQDYSTEIATDGSVVRTGERKLPDLGSPVDGGENLAPADLHPGQIPSGGNAGEVALARSEP